MEFRPCIDIHNGQVKQIVGSSLSDDKDFAVDNFVAKKSADYYADMYKEHGLRGGHIILLNSKESDYYDATRAQALLALNSYPGGLQVGGGINSSNAKMWIDAGATHVIVTSALFEDGKLSIDAMEKISSVVGPENLVFDLSCKRIGDKYFICTNRWQTVTEVSLDAALLKELEKYCDEYLIHAVDVEGKANGIEEDLVVELARYTGNAVTYAGGIHNMNDLDILYQKGEGRINATIGSALDIFGGNMKFDEVISHLKKFN